MDFTSRKLYKKDGAGDTIRFLEALWKGEILHFAPYFEHIPEVLGDLERFQPREDDVWILTYPKAGTHFLYEIVGILLSGRAEPLNHFKSKKMVEVKSGLSDLQEEASPRLMNTHIRLKYLPDSIQTKGKIICCVRNPKSSAVSFYFHNLNAAKMEYSGTFKGYLQFYLFDEDNLYGNWFNYNFEIWDKLYGKKNVLFVFYEDMIKNPVKNIQEISAFLGTNTDKDFCERVAGITSFDKMSTAFGKNPEASALKQDGKNTIFRKGSVEDWKNYFTVEENRQFNEIYETKMAAHLSLKEKIQFE